MRPSFYYAKGLVLISLNSAGEPYNIHTFMQQDDDNNVHIAVTPFKALSAEAKDAIVSHIEPDPDPVTLHPDDNLARRQILEAGDGLEGTGEAGIPTDHFTVCPECDPEQAVIESESDHGRTVILCSRHWPATPPSAESEARLAELRRMGPPKETT